MNKFEHIYDIKPSGDDHVIPFQVEGLDVRGRAVQLGPILDQILTRHTYPELIAQLLAQSIALVVLLGTSLKFEGRLILQTKGDGAVNLLVADFQAPGSVRAYAQFDQAAFKSALEAGTHLPHQLLGRGTLAFTIDQGVHMQRYQGIVEMKGETLSEMAEAYFRQSEQIPTKIKLGVAKLMRGHNNTQNDENQAQYHKAQYHKAQYQWRAGGIITQFLPHSNDRISYSDLPRGDLPEKMDTPLHEEKHDDAWLEAKALLETIDISELTDPQIGSERLLYRLFHERGVWIYEAGKVQDECRCSRDNLFNVLSQMEQSELSDNAVDETITVICEFCSTNHRFDINEFAL